MLLRICVGLILLMSFQAQAFVTSLNKAPQRANDKGVLIKFLVSPELQKSQSGFMAHMTIPAHGAVPEHRDTSEEYLYVLSGRGQLWIDDKMYSIEPGSAVFMPAHSKVKFQAGDQPVQVIQFFAPLGSEKKYEKWKVVTEPRS